jgi:hypothetical protein
VRLETLIFKTTVLEREAVICEVGYTDIYTKLLEQEAVICEAGYTDI